MTTDTQRVLLVSMPWRDPNAPCLSLGTLSPVLRQAGIAVDTLYGYLHFPRTHNELCAIYPFSTLLFMPHLYPGTVFETLWEAALSWVERESLRGDRLGQYRQCFDAMQADVERAGICLERCLNRAKRHAYDVVGFSVTYETQIAASLALANRLKEANPLIKVIFGGAACLGTQAEALIASFAQIDAVCHTEGELVIAPLVRALCGERPLDQVPGIAYRLHDKVQRNEAPPLIGDLDSLPMPQYEDFIEQYEQSEWRDLPCELYFETSRGCWWGQKKACRFCGLNPYGRVFRSKSALRAQEEIRALYHDYPRAKMLRAVDNSLQVKYFRTLFPRLSELDQQPDRPLELFYEVRPNLRREQVALLAQSGVVEIQLGIESFSDPILKLMNKGVTALGNVQVLKWVHEHRIRKVLYNLITNTPGEQPRHYRQMLDWIRFINHLPPPTGLTRMMLMRFSHFFTHPQDYNLSNIRPNPYYEALFAGRNVDLMGLSYHFDYDDPNDSAELEACRQELMRAVVAWSRNWRPDMAFHVDRGESIVLVDRREGEATAKIMFGKAAEIYRFLDQTRTRDAVARRFDEVDQRYVDVALLLWHTQRWTLRDERDRHLAVLPCAGQKSEQCGSYQGQSVDR